MRHPASRQRLLSGKSIATTQLAQQPAALRKPIHRVLLSGAVPRNRWQTLVDGTDWWEIDPFKDQRG